MRYKIIHTYSCPLYLKPSWMLSQRMLESFLAWTYSRSIESRPFSLLLPSFGWVKKNLKKQNIRNIIIHVPFLEFHICLPVKVLYKARKIEGNLNSLPGKILGQLTIQDLKFHNLRLQRGSMSICLSSSQITLQCFFLSDYLNRQASSAQDCWKRLYRVSQKKGGLAFKCS